MFICGVAATLTLPWWRGWRMRTFALSVVLLCTAGLLFTLTRQTWIAAAAGAVCAMLADRRLRAWLPAAAVMTAAIVALALAFVPGLSQSASERLAAQSPIWDRLNSDSAALRMIEARPALGFGWGRFGVDSVPYYRLAATYPLTSVEFVHNVPLSNGSELGLVGVALWLAVLAGALAIPTIRRPTPALAPWRLGLIAIAVAWFLQQNLAPMDYAFDNYVVWLWAGIVAAATVHPARPAHADRIPTRQGLTAEQSLASA
jgi:putative inorganic carbon (HCO3(-)) transporter